MRRTHWVVMTLVAVLAVAFSGLTPAEAASTTKKLSSNFTLVNLENGTNAYTISYYKPDGGDWRSDVQASFTTLGEQLQYRQYTDPDLTSGRGSVVVTSDGPLGAVVQVLARDGQTPSFGAYIGVNEGATSVGIPVVIRRRNTASGLANSQIIVQNASSISVNIDIDLIDSSTGTKTYTKQATIAPSAAYEYDLDDEDSANVPEGWVGSAVVKSTTAGGEIAVVSNLFRGADAMQTFNGVPQASASAASTSASEKWFVPLFFSRLDNNLSSVVAVQNVSGGEIPVNAITMKCKPDRDGLTEQTWKNSKAVKDTASFEFNPVPPGDGNANWTLYPKEWRGACVITTTGYATNVFVQMRIVNPNDALDPKSQAADAYSAFSAGDDVVVFPKFSKRLPNGLATSLVVQNLDESNDATVKLEFKASPETPRAECTVTKDNVTIKAGQNLNLNLRLPIVDPPIADSFNELADNCEGSLIVTSKNGQPINGMVQLTIVTDLTNVEEYKLGDTFMAHNALTISN